MNTKKVPKSSDKFCCKNCDYTTSRKSQYERHLLTAKHQRIQENTVKSSKKEQTYTCEICEREYKFHSGLWKHKKTCVPLDEANTNTQTTTFISTTSEIPDNDRYELLTNTILELVKKNDELTSSIVEISKQIGNNNNNTNINSNNKFNLNVFLNEKCKDAMSLTDFVKSLEITMDDFIQTGELGFVDGLSRVMIERINNMDLYNRPIHCTDLKRETLYIKDAEKWEKDANKEQLRKAVKGVAYKNDSMRPIWYSETPDVDVLGTENCEKFLKYSQSALGGCGKEETKLFEDKIMKNILKEVTINKDI
jgi:hypothetical protein